MNALRPRPVLPCALALVLRAATASAQTTLPPETSTVREEILGYDPSSSTLSYVERTPTPLAGLFRFALVRATRDGGATRVPLTTAGDVEQVRAARDRVAARATIEARVARDIAAERARLQPGTVIPVAAPATLSPARCERAPFPVREVPLGATGTVRIAPLPDGATTSVLLTRDGRSGAATEVSAVTLTVGETSVPAPYDLVVDARELPGTDAIAVLLRSDACTPENASVAARAVLLAAPPPPERSLHPFSDAELGDFSTIPLLAPRARRRVVDEITGYFEGRTRIVVDASWQLPQRASDPQGSYRYLVQYTRQDGDLPPSAIEAGTALARFALLESRRGHRRLLSQFVPPPSENVIEGAGVGAYLMDLDGDGTPEMILRTRYLPSGEVTTVLQVGDQGIQLLWHTTTAADERASGTSAQPEVRHCTLGEDAGPTLVVRCNIERYAPGAARDSQPVSRTRLVQRVRFNGGAVQVQEERR